MQDSVYTKIIKGEIPCQKIYEDDMTLAFLDIDPLLPGHTLVIPKIQVDHFEDLPDDYYQAVFATVKRVAKHEREVLAVSRSIIMVMGYDVPHTHVHILPTDQGINFYQAISDRLAGGTDTSEPDFTALAAMAQRLALPS